MRLPREDVRDEKDVPLHQALDGESLRKAGWMWEVVRRTAQTGTEQRPYKRPRAQCVM